MATLKDTIIIGNLNISNDVNIVGKLKLGGNLSLGQGTTITTPGIYCSDTIETERLTIYGDKFTLTGRKITYDADTTLYAEGFHISNSDDGTSQYLYFPDKTGTIALEKNLVHYGTCTTAAATVAKVATIADTTADFVLETGVTVRIKFTNSNTVDDPTLNVNSTGAKAIKRYGTTAVAKTATTSWYAGSVVTLTYDGTNWIMNDYKYDTDADTKMRQYHTLTTSNAEYPLLYSYTTATGTSSYKTTYGAVKGNFTFNPSTNTITMPNTGGGTNKVVGASTAGNYTFKLPTSTGVPVMTLTTTDGLVGTGDNNGKVYTTLATKDYVDTKIGAVSGGSSFTINDVTVVGSTDDYTLATTTTGGYEEEYLITVNHTITSVVFDAGSYGLFTLDSNNLSDYYETAPSDQETYGVGMELDLTNNTIYVYGENSSINDGLSCTVYYNGDEGSSCSIIDLGTMSENPTVPANAVLNQATESGLYTVTWETNSYLVFVNRLTGEGYDYVYQTVFNGAYGSLNYYSRFSMDGGVTYTINTYTVQDRNDKVNISKAGTSNSNYEIAYSNTSGLTTSVTTVSDSLRSSYKFYYNPGTQTLTVPKIQGGTGTTLSGSYAYTEGYQTTASGEASHAEGYQTTASGKFSHASGLGTIANNYQFVTGHYNADTTAPTSTLDTTAAAGLFIVGIGGGGNGRTNGFRVNPAGNVYGVGAFGTSGADYAEYFEWIDGNPNNEDRRGHFVTLEGGKIRYANPTDDYILGVVSGNPSVISDVHSENWHNMYLKDIYGSKIVKVIEVEETIDENGEIIPAHTEKQWVLNPNYNPDTKYVSREERPEWAAIGIVGKLVVVDDGTCQINGYCYPNVDGIATSSQDKTNYRVMERLDDIHIRIFIR